MGEVIYICPGAVGVFSESVRVEGSDRIALLELRTGRPATGTPITSIALGDSTVPLVDQNANHLDENGHQWPIQLLVIELRHNPHH